jgi:hypothetical protein
MSKSFEEVLEDSRNLSQDDQLKLTRELTKPHPAELQYNADGSIRTLYDALLERGLIGFVKDGPPDLSTNPNHIEGFGES